MEFHLVMSRQQALLAVAALAAGILMAQSLAADVYRWTDENGVVHFTNRPPEGQTATQMDISEDPEPGSFAPSSAAPATTAAMAVDEAEAESDSEEILTPAQARRKQLAEQRKDKYEADAEAAQECRQHSQRLAQMEPARRVFYTDESGESVRMDDNERMELIEESRAYLAEHCS